MPVMESNAVDAVDPNPKNVQDLTIYIQTVMQQMQDRFQSTSDQIVGRIDDMGRRIDDLEKNIADMLTQTSAMEGSASGDKQ